MTRRTILILQLCYCLGAMALPERPVSIGVGVGLPDLLMAQGTVLAIPPRIQVGFGYGIDGGLSSSVFPDAKSFLVRAVVARDIPFADGHIYRVDPNVQPVGLVMWTPFIRYFPGSDNTYLQLTWAMMRLGTEFSANVVDPGSGISFDGILSGTIKFVQHIPTVSIGHIFSSQAFFADVRLGASILYNGDCSVDLKAAIPSNLGGTEANAQALKDLTNQLQDLITKGADEAKKRVFIIPAVTVVFGIIL